MLYGVVTYNGLKSSDYGINVSFFPDYSAPEREYDIIPVPGRNGDVFIDSGSFKNVNRSYQVSLGDREHTFTYLANRLSQWLHGAVGYVRLEDTYDPDIYRMAVFKDAVDVTNVLNYAAEATISFVCKPQRFLKTGDIQSKVGNGAYVNNTTTQIALPEIQLKGTGSGTLQVGDVTVKILKITNGMIINSDIRNTYSSDKNSNLNFDIELDSSRRYPILKPGKTRISYTGGIREVLIKPKWWIV